MPTNIYDQPFQAQYMNTYVPMPYQEILQAGAVKQDRYDTAEAMDEQIQDQLMQSKYLKWSAEDKEMVAQKQKEYSDRINKKLEEVGGDYGSLMPFIKSEQKKYKKEITTGQLGHAAANYESYWKNYEEEKKRLKKGKINENSFRTQRAQERANYHGVGDINDLAGIELEYAVVKQDIQEEVFKVADKLEAKNSKEIGEWALRVLPSGHELLERTDFTDSKLSPETIYKLANAAVRNNPEIAPYLEERAGLKVWEVMEQARNTPGGFEELASSALKLSEEDIVEGMELSGYAPNNPTDRENYLEYKYKEALKDSLVSQQAAIAGGVFAKDDIIESRATRVPSDGGEDTKSGYDDYTQNLVIGKTKDLINNTMSGIKFQEKNLTTQKENITSLESRVAKAKEIQANNPSVVYDAEIEQLETELNNAEVELTTSEAELRNAYGVADVVDPSTGEMITDSYIEKRVKEKGDAAELRAQEAAEIMRQAGDSSRDIARIPGRETAELVETRRLETIRDEALEKAQEEGVFATTKFPYVFTSTSSGEYDTVVGNNNKLNTADFYENGGTGWSLVLNGGELPGVAFADYFKEFKDNEGSDQWSGYTPTGQVFVRMTNQVDNGGYPVYTVGIEGKTGDGETKVVSSHLITKGDAGGTAASGEFYNLAMALSQDPNNAQFRDIGDQMLADIYVKPYVGKLDIQNLKLNQPIGIPGMKDPDTDQQIKLIKTGLGDITTSEFVAVIDTPEGQESDSDIIITHDGKEARYLPVTNIAGGEEDLYQRLYQFHKGKSEEIQRKEYSDQEAKVLSEKQKELKSTLTRTRGGGYASENNNFLNIKDTADSTFLANAGIIPVGVDDAGTKGTPGHAVFATLEDGWKAALAKIQNIKDGTSKGYPLYNENSGKATTLLEFSKIYAENPSDIDTLLSTLRQVGELYNKKYIFSRNSTLVDIFKEIPIEHFTEAMALKEDKDKYLLGKKLNIM